MEDAEKKKKLDELIAESKYCDSVQFIAREINEKGSLDSIDKSLDYIMKASNLTDEQKKKLNEVAGNAHLLLLDLEGAKKYYGLSCNSDKKRELLETALWYGKFPKLVKEICTDKDAYRRFLVEKGITNVTLLKDEEGYSLDVASLNFALCELKNIGIGKDKVLDYTLRKLFSCDNRNSVKKFLLAKYSGNQVFIGKAYAEFKAKQEGRRRFIDSDVKIYAASHGFKFVRKLQEGDHDDFFPIASNLYLVEKEGKSEVWKENLKLYVDFSRLDGYNEEKEIYEAIDNKGIIKHLGTIKIDGSELLRFEFFGGKQLSEYTKKDNVLSADKTVGVIKELANTIDYLHSQGIIYMDMKDKNVMYDGNEVKLLDFGMARRCKSLDDSTVVRSLLSTPAYVTPEWGTSFKVYKSSDVFQLGILFYQMLTGKHPFANYDFKEGDEFRESEIIKYSLSNIFNEYNSKELDNYPILNDLLAKMLDKDPIKRPTMRQVAETLSNDFVAKDYENILLSI